MTAMELIEELVPLHVHSMTSKNTSVLHSCMCRGFHQHILLWNSMSRVLSSRVVMLGSNPCLTTCASFSGAWDKTDNGLYEPHWTTFPIPTTVGYLRHARKDVVYNSCCKCKKATCIGLSWCEATGQRNNTILHIMFHNWTSYALYNWSNITRWNAWVCGASLREQHAAGGQQNSTVE